MRMRKHFATGAAMAGYHGPDRMRWRIVHFNINQQ